MKIGDVEHEKEILISHIRIDQNGCWNWTASKNSEGYGNINIGSRKDGSRKTAKAHRVAFFAFTGTDPEGYDVCHKCDNPSCINPDHLFLGTESDNMRDMVNKGRQAHIPSEEYPTAKLTSKDVLKIRELRKRGKSYYSMAKMFGVYKETIRSAIVGKTWKHLEEGAHKPEKEDA